MADNLTLNAGTGGATLATDDVSSVHFQKVKIDVGGDGVSTALSNSNPLPVSDAGGSLTVDNTVLSVVGNGAAATAQRVTIANDSTGVIAVTDNGGSLTVDGTVAVSGTVTVGSHAVTNAGTFATQVDGAALTALQLIDNLVLAEDAAHSSGDPGLMAFAVRRDADTSLVGADGDYAPLQVNSTGSLKVAITAGAGSGGTSIADGASFTRNTTSITTAGAVVETSAPTLTDGDAAGLSMTTGGALRVAVASGGIAGIAEDSAAAGGEEGIMILAVRRDAASSGVSADGDFAALSVTSDGSLRVSGSAGTTQYTEDGASAGGESLCLMGAVRRDTAASSSGTDGDYSTLNTDASGRLHVNVGNTVTVASHAVTNAGTFATQIDGAALTALQLLDNASIADDAAFTAATTGVQMGGFVADESSTDSVDEGDGGAARMTLDRKQIVTAYVHAAAGGQTPYKNLDCDESEDEIKGTAGKLYWVHCVNLANAKRYLKFYNATAANVTVGTTTPVLTFPIPTQGDTNGAGFTINFGAQGVQFDTALTVAATTGFADNDTGAPGANEVILNAGYA